ncbi:MAG: class I SAM-dependent methyltransferase [Chloroflexi bacterium]|nr:class I SAM-dependent methyltransferase [Chloroflexota bacterium]
MSKDIVSHNEKAWDRLVEQRDRWTQPVSHEEILAAKDGNWQVILTGEEPVPRDWFPERLTGVDILCLASGGGQQDPILSAAGANITAFDNSPKQLERDRYVAEREGLSLTTVQGDMRDLSTFSDEQFDLVFHPVANVFVPDIQPVWAEAYRVLRPGGHLLAGFMNPVEFIFDSKELDEGRFVVKYSLPYSDIESISEQEWQERYGAEAPLEFSHTLEAQIGGQIQAGFVIVGFYESLRERGVIAEYMPSYIATRALKRASDQMDRETPVAEKLSIK